MPENPENTSSRPRFTFTFRKSRFIFVIVMMIATLAIVWPGYALFSSAEPLILGFPLSFAWIIFWVIVSFTAMLALYISDIRHEGLNGDDHQSSGDPN